MTPDELVALLQLLAGLRLQITVQAQEIDRLTAELAQAVVPRDD